MLEFFPRAPDRTVALEIFAVLGVGCGTRIETLTQEPLKRVGGRVRPRALAQQSKMRVFEIGLPGSASSFPIKFSRVFLFPRALLGTVACETLVVLGVGRRTWIDRKTR